MDSPQSGFSTRTIFILLAGIAALVYLYRFLYASVTNTPVILVSDESSKAPTPALKATSIPQPFEGGEYSFNTWVYVNNFRTNQNMRKPIFDLQGQSNSGAFSTLFVGLGAQTNTLVVRTHSQTPGAVEGFQSDAPAPTPVTDNSLYIMDRPNFLAGTDSALTTPEPVCDLPTVDLQRWVMITVVLSGRTIDVYMDGKLARSCVTKSYYKVDPAGVLPVILGGGPSASLDGFISAMSVAPYAMNPGEIYRLYSSGPKANQTFISWLISLVTGSQPV